MCTEILEDGKSQSSSQDADAQAVHSDVKSILKLLARFKGHSHLRASSKADSNGQILRQTHLGGQSALARLMDMGLE